MAVLVRQARWVSSMFGKFRHVVFLFSWYGRCVGLGSGVLWCVRVIYGEAGGVLRGVLCLGLMG